MPVMGDDHSLWRRVIQLQLIPPSKRLFHARVRPQTLNSICDPRGEDFAFNLGRARHDDIPVGLITRVNGNAHERDTFEEDPGCQL